MNPMLVANWKMYPTLTDALVLISSLKEPISDIKGVDVVIAPPQSWLVSVVEAWHPRTSHVSFAAQNIWPEDQGAFTGEVSPFLLKDIVRYALVGHSERRKYAHEDNEQANEKVQACLRWQIRPILCVGEEVPIFDASNQLRTAQWERLKEQLEQGLSGVSKERVAEVVVAYEPVWAIGTGKPASGSYANSVTKRLRQTLASLYDDQTAGRITILYGGSVSPTNAAEFLGQAEVNGLLPGSVSVKAKDFLEICRIASKVRH